MNRPISIGRSNWFGIPSNVHTGLFQPFLRGGYLRIDAISIEYYTRQKSTELLVPYEKRNVESSG